MSALSYSFDRVRIVLVNTSHPGNIGASARAMKNMGLSRLALVQPVDFPSSVAVGRAASALEILEGATLHDSLAEAVSDCGLIIGASARSRKIPWPVLLPEQCADQVVRGCRHNEVALVFGREDCGLTNEELQLCHFHVQIPTSPDYSSLNLAAAVLVICYEVRRAALRTTGDEAPSNEDYWDIERATADQMERYYVHLERVLERLDFLVPDNPRQLMQRVRRLYGRIRLDGMEINILRGMLTHVEYHLDNPDSAEGRSRRRREQRQAAASLAGIDRSGPQESESLEGAPQEADPKRPSGVESCAEVGQQIEKPRQGDADAGQQKVKERQNDADAGQQKVKERQNDADAGQQNETERQGDEDAGQTGRRRKDFAQASANKRQLDTMVEILQAARKNRRDS